MMLGLTECDEEIAHILKYGKPKPYERHNCKQIQPCESDDYDYEHDLELYREFQQANFDEYFDWAGTYRYCLFK